MSVSLIMALAALWVAVLVQAAVICGLFHTNVRLLRLASSGGLQGRGLPKGSSLPLIKLVDANTGVLYSAQEICKKKGYLIFVTTSCGMCDQVIKPILRKNRQEAISVYCDGDRKNCIREFGEYKSIDLLVRHDEDPIIAFDLATLPAVVHIDNGANIVSYSYPVTSTGLENILYFNHGKSIDD